MMTGVPPVPHNSYKKNHRNKDGRNALDTYLVSVDTVAKLQQFACLNLPGYFYFAVKC